MSYTVPITTIQDPLDRGRLVMTAPLRRALGKLAPQIAAVAGYHFEWFDAGGSPTTATTGKALRAALALLSAEAAGGDIDTGVPGAVAVELVHNSSLLRDDLISGEQQRHLRETTWKAHGPEQAILVGDALAVLAFELLLELGSTAGARAAHVLSTATRKLLHGQAQDVAYKQRVEVSVAECLETACNKTAALLACAASIGAVLAAGHDNLVDALHRYGHHLGLAFQAVDDMVGIWGDPATTGRPAWSDLRRRRKSLPVVAALTLGGEASRRLAERLLTDARAGHRTTCSDDFALRAALIEEAGGRVWTMREAQRHHGYALEALHAVEMQPETRASLVAIADFVVDRNV